MIHASIFSAGFSAAWLAFQQSAADPSAAAPAAPAAVSNSAILEMLHNSGPVALVVLGLLLLTSLYSWAIMLQKWSSFRRARSQSVRFLRAFRKTAHIQEAATISEQFKPSPLVAVFDETYAEYKRQSENFGHISNAAALQRAAQSAASEALTTLESRMTWLATIGAVAPFLGLFGTIWGIIDAFHGLGTAGAATLRAVAPGVSEALITTAAGLAVAVPAVVGYNQYTAQLREFAARLDDFARELLNALEDSISYGPGAQTAPFPSESPSPTQIGTGGHQSPYLQGSHGNLPRY
jgi:biopolymer transport protein TolQ